jgi:gamma-glutamyltranspeptidase / glutathione hydrolase
VVKAVIARIDWGMDAQAIAELFNFGSRNGPFELERLPGAERWAAALEAYGHEVRIVNMTSGLNLIVVDDTGAEGGT